MDSWLLVAATPAIKAPWTPFEFPKKDELGPLWLGCAAGEPAPRLVELPNPLGPIEFPKPVEEVELPNPLEPVAVPCNPPALEQPGDEVPIDDIPMDELPIDDPMEEDPKEEPPPNVELVELDCPNPAGLPQLPPRGWFLESISTPAAFT